MAVQQHLAAPQARLLDEVVRMGEALGDRLILLIPQRHPLESARPGPCFNLLIAALAMNQGSIQWR